ncbi:unnamed protein product [Adineta steineri]|uniref:Uncharacterized protein n=1 Tax=Adineta steineri TaxID=433720 RepID=A0A816E724_9BILA|nr:unnamed protein product [Adineta steineri]CAF1642252.1 unnamed protein product [Adineta steineri]
MINSLSNGYEVIYSYARFLPSVTRSCLIESLEDIVVPPISKLFKTEASDMKEVTTTLNVSQRRSFEDEMEIITAALEQTYQDKEN